MILIDTNLWLYASLRELPHHQRARQWLDSVMNGEESIALPWSVVLAILRISTQPRLLRQPLPLEHDCTLCSADNDFRRFPGLRFLDPLR